MPSVGFCTSPASPETGVCVGNPRRTWWVLWGQGSLRCGVLQAVPTRSACSPELAMSLLGSGRCCTPDKCAFATVLRGLDLCFVGWCWIRIPPFGGDGCMTHALTILSRAAELFSEPAVCWEVEFHGLGSRLWRVIGLLPTTSESASNLSLDGLSSGVVMGGRDL
jgi:hypothetical protein